MQNGFVRYLPCLLLFGFLLPATTSGAQELPAAPAWRGEVARDASGKLVVVPGSGSERRLEAPPALPATVSINPRAGVSVGERVVATGQGGSPPDCAPRAVTCVEIVSTGTSTAEGIPVTFGQVFKIGDVPRGASLTARDADQHSLPLQSDEATTHPDGSLRFAVLSTRLPKLAAGEKSVISLFMVSGKPGPAAPTAAAGKPDLALRATLYSPQVSLLTFGNRDGVAPGIPFAAGEEITLQLGDAPDERFTLTVSDDLAGGNYPTLTKLAEAFMRQINGRSRAFRAFKTLDGCTYDTLCVTTRAPDGSPFAVRLIYTGKARLASRTVESYRAPRQYEAKLQGAGQTRLSGPVVNESVYVLPFFAVDDGKRHPQLTARLHVRRYAGDASVRTDLVLENAWAYAPEPGNLLYELTAMRDGRPVFQQPPFTHFHHARWHRVLWSGEAPQIQLRHHMPYFLSSRATWNYDLGLGVPERVLADEAARLASADTGPMGAALITPYFPGTGGRADIGPLPRWTALYLVSQDARARAAMLANADAGAGIPIHYREQGSDQPISLDAHPGVALGPGQSAAVDAPPPLRFSPVPWVVDISHQPSLAYIPYLVTGDLFYAEEIAFWAARNLAAIAPEYRGMQQGLLHAEQVRGQAWGLRSLAEAAYALPDRHPMKNYFRRKLSDNLAWYAAFYPNGAGKRISPLGLAEKDGQLDNTRPWMNDFLAVVLGWLAANGESHAKATLKWLSRFTVGRFLHEADGYCRAKGPAYTLKVFDEHRQPITDWGKLYRLNFPQEPECKPDTPVYGYRDLSSGYAGNAKAMAATLSDLDIPGAAETYEWLVSAMPKVAEDARRDPTWAIVPRKRGP